MDSDYSFGPVPGQEYQNQAAAAAAAASSGGSPEGPLQSALGLLDGPVLIIRGLLHCV
jgi:hypothetical protein